MGKRKKTTGGSLRGFALLLIVIAIALFVYQHREGKALVNIPISELKETVINNIPESPKAQAPSTLLEIPASTRRRDEIRLQRTAFTLSYNDFYKTPNWVAWELTREETEGTEKVRKAGKASSSQTPTCPNRVWSTATIPTPDTTAATWHLPPT